MGRPASPWYWAARDEWWTTHNGERAFLGKTRDEAYQAFHQLKASGQHAARSGLSLFDLLDRFLFYCEANNAPRTLASYQERLQAFVDEFRAEDCEAVALRPATVQAWLDKHPEWSSTWKHGIVTAIKRAFNWGVKMQLIASSPLAGLAKPQPKKRELVISQAQFDAMLVAEGLTPFADVLRFTWLTGARPQETIAIESRHVRNGSIVFPVDESKGKRSQRTIILSGESAKLVDQLAKRHPTGPLFRNARGARWTAYAFNNAFSRLKKKIGYKCCMYSLRHSFAHRMLTDAKISPEVLATLMGHADTSMVYGTYGHLTKNADYLREQLERGDHSTKSSG